MTLQGYVQKSQNTEMEIIGPSGANRLYNYFGEINIGFYTPATPEIVSDSIRFQLDDEFQPKEIIRATGIMSINEVTVRDVNSYWKVSDFDVYWDDDSGKITMTASIRGRAVSIQRLSYSIQVLAQK